MKKILLSPLTNKIYIASVNRKGIAIGSKTEATMDCLAASAQHLFREKSDFFVSLGNKKLILKVEELKSDPATPKKHESHA